MAENDTAPLAGGPSVTFYNVTITITDARDPADAYDLLCRSLASQEESAGITVEWTTDTYSADALNEDVRPVSELFPPEGSVRETKGRA